LPVSSTRQLQFQESAQQLVLPGPQDHGIIDELCINTTMKTSIIDRQDPLPAQADLVVVVDVFRAFTTSCYIMEQKPRRYIPVETVEEAFALRQLMPTSVLIGERHGVRIDGFDFGNSPTEILSADLADRTCIHTTTGGTRGLVRPPESCRVVTGGFVNALAVQKFIEKGRYQFVVFLCTAEDGRAEEDLAFSHYMIGQLAGRQVDFASIKETLAETSGRKILEGTFAPASDFEYCMALNRFLFVLERIKSEQNAWRYEIARIDVWSK
jgi:2-phosphosulfolactate phosphatase